MAGRSIWIIRVCSVSSVPALHSKVSSEDFFYTSYDDDDDVDDDDDGVGDADDVLSDGKFLLKTVLFQKSHPRIQSS